MADDEIEIVPSDADDKAENISGDEKAGDNEGDNKSTVGSLNTMDAAV